MVTCLPSAGFGYRSLVAVVAGQTSETSNMSYAPATVVEITPKSEEEPRALDNFQPKPCKQTKLKNPTTHYQIYCN